MLHLVNYCKLDYQQQPSVRLQWKMYMGCKTAKPCITMGDYRLRMKSNILSQIAKFMEPKWGPSGSAPDGPHVGPMNLAIRDISLITLRWWRQGRHMIRVCLETTNDTLHVLWHETRTICTISSLLCNSPFINIMQHHQCNTISSVGYANSWQQSSENMV